MTIVKEMIALTELDSQNFTLGNTMEQLIADDNIDDWYLAIGKYFRYRKSYFREDLMRVFLKRFLMLAKMICRFSSKSYLNLLKPLTVE